MSITTLIEGHDAERGFFILVVLSCCCVHEESYSTSKLFVPALHALTRMGTDWRGTIKCIEDALEARRCIEDAQEARNWFGTPRQQRPTHGVGSPILGSVAGWSELSDRAHGVCFESAHSGTRVRGSWCLYCGQRHCAVDRQAHALGFALYIHCIYYLRPQAAWAAQPRTKLFINRHSSRYCRAAGV
jgi:hypothetical protein